MTPEQIDEVILDLGCRNAAGGIYTGSVYEFAKAIAAVARAEAIEECARRLSMLGAKQQTIGRRLVLLYGVDAIRALATKKEGT